MRDLLHFFNHQHNCLSRGIYMSCILHIWLSSCVYCCCLMSSYLLIFFTNRQITSFYQLPSLAITKVKRGNSSYYRCTTRLYNYLQIKLILITIKLGYSLKCHAETILQSSTNQILTVHNAFSVVY